MIVRILGSAAGGGVPQWNCACANCSAVRAGSQPARSQSGFAFSVDGDGWYLVNVSPDIAGQIEAFAALQPRTTRGTPILGAFITDANVDHLGGLATLRQQGEHRFTLRSSATIRAIATEQVAFAPFARAPHQWLAVDAGVPCVPAFPGDPVGTLLDVTPIAAPGTTPGYAGRRAAPDAVFAYAVSDRRSGGSVLFAPVFAGIDETLRHAIAAAGLALLDGSFYEDAELPDLGLMAKRARDLGHQPVGGAGGTLEVLSGIGTRPVFVHLNNSNPMLDPESAAARSVVLAGAEVGYDGLQFSL
jgi:pyrroloquinoline quinone biosynthesis protein B